MNHVFNPSHKHKLESDFRKEILSKEPVIEFISGIAPEERRTALELGSGTGYFTVILARYFEKVYGIDVSAEMIEYLADRLQDEGTKNVGLIAGDKPPIDFEVDLAFFANVLHEVKDPGSYLDYPAKMVIVIDWKIGKDGEASFGPPPDVRIPEEEMIEIMEYKGYKTEKIDAYWYHYFIVGIRKE
ncbi:MAG: class I SAM-dependent methyltransferase [Archaeoglobaceae archaeon]